MFKHLKIVNSLDLGAGCAMMALASAFLYFGRGLDHGVAYAMGPGYFPRYVAGLLFMVGTVVATKGLTTRKEVGFAIKFRPFLAIIGAMVFFTMAVRPLGLAVTAAGTIAIASFASTPVKPLQVAMLAIGMGAMTTAIFIYGLGIPLPIWPDL